MKYNGMIVDNAVPLASRIGTVTFDVESNLGLTQGAGSDKGQPAPCGAITHVGPVSSEIFAARKPGGATVSMDPSATPGFSFDQLDDPDQYDATGAGTQGDGWPTGIGNIPAVVPSFLALFGILPSNVIERGYGVAVVAAGTPQTTLTLLTLAGGSLPGTADAITTVFIVGNPFGSAVAATQFTMICPPFSSSVKSFGTTLASAGAHTILGAIVGGDYTPAAPAGTGGYDYGMLISSIGDEDGDGLSNNEDRCPTVADPGHAAFAGIGLACASARVTTM
jgi:hypothetical protein